MPLYFDSHNAEIRRSLEPVDPSLVDAEEAVANENGGARTLSRAIDRWLAVHVALDPLPAQR